MKQYFREKVSAPDIFIKDPGLDICIGCRLCAKNCPMDCIRLEVANERKNIPPPGGSSERMDERGWIELPEGNSVADALRAIHCSRLKEKLLFCNCNGERTNFRTPLQDGNVIGFFSPISGG